MDLLKSLLLEFMAILPVVNPFSKPPIFLSITEGMPEAERRRQAFKASLYSFIILLVSLLAGTFILEFFSISLPALQIAGGLLIARTGFQMLSPRREHHQTGAEEEESQQSDDISFVPLAMPLLSGPGAMAVMINLATDVTVWSQWLVIMAASALVCLVSYFVLRESSRLVVLLGVNGINALSKLMGFLLVSLAVQFVINGLDSVAVRLAHTLHA